MLLRIYDPYQLKDITIKKQERRLRKGKKSARRKAAIILGCIGSEESRFDLRKSLKDEDAKVRRYSAWALGEIGNDSSVKALINALKDSDEDVQSYAVWALGKLENYYAIDSIVELLENNEKRRVQSNALHVLILFDDEKVSKAIIKALRFEWLDFDIKWILLNGKLKKKVDFLIQELKINMHTRVRREIATILGELKVKKAVRPLIQALDDKDVYVRIETVKALAKIQDKRAVPGLAARLNDDISDVRNAARKALTTIAKAEDPMSVKTNN